MTKAKEKTAAERKDELKAELDKMGVDYDGRASEESLQELLGKAKSDTTKAPEGAKQSSGPKPGKRAARAKSDDETPVPSVRVLIVKDETTTIPKRVFEHEVPILQTIWGEDKIEVVEGSEIELDLDGNADTEFARLLRVYGRKHENAVRAVYHNPGSLADEIGIAAPRARSAKSRIASGPQSGARGKGVI